MSTIIEKARQILNEKNSQIIPENIKKNVKIFDITGTYEGSGGGDLSPEDQETLDKMNQIVEDFNQDNSGIINFSYNVSENASHERTVLSIKNTIEGYDAGVFKCDMSVTNSVESGVDNRYVLDIEIKNLPNYNFHEYSDNHKNVFAIIKIYSGNKVIHRSDKQFETSEMSEDFTLNTKYSYLCDKDILEITGVEINFYGNNEG